MSNVLWRIRANGAMGKKAKAINLFERYATDDAEHLLITPIQFDLLQKLLNPSYNSRLLTHQNDKKHKNKNKHKKWKSYYSYRRYNPEPLEFTGEIYIVPKIFEKMTYYTRMVSSEISGLGKVERVKDNYHIVDVKILEQKCTAAHTTLSEEDLSKFLFELIKGGEKPENWNLWWHTHNDFGTYFSGEDEDTIEQLSKDSLLLSICINKHNEISARIDDRGKAEERVPVFPFIANKRTLEDCKKEVDEKVTVGRWGGHKNDDDYGYRYKKYSKYKKRNKYEVGLTKQWDNILQDWIYI